MVDKIIVSIRGAKDRLHVSDVPKISGNSYTGITPFAFTDCTIICQASEFNDEIVWNKKRDACINTYGPPGVDIEEGGRERRTDTGREGECVSRTDRYREGEKVSARDRYIGYTEKEKCERARERQGKSVRGTETWKERECESDGKQERK